MKCGAQEAFLALISARNRNPGQSAFRTLYSMNITFDLV